MPENTFGEQDLEFDEEAYENLQNIHAINRLTADAQTVIPINGSSLVLVITWETEKFDEDIPWVPPRLGDLVSIVDTGVKEEIQALLETNKITSTVERNSRLIAEQEKFYKKRELSTIFTDFSEWYTECMESEQEANKLAKALTQLFKKSQAAITFDNSGLKKNKKTIDKATSKFEKKLHSLGFEKPKAS